MLWRESVELALQRLGGSASLRDLYKEVRRVRTLHRDSVPAQFEAVVRRELEYNSSDSSQWKRKHDLFFSLHGIGGGYWGLRSRMPASPIAADMELPLQPPNREVVTTLRVIRDTALAKKVKALHDCRCQICGETIELGARGKYAEAHHLIPLGQPHNGPDCATNIVVVCPNHHAMLDFGGMQLSQEALHMVAGHQVAEVSINYHNQRIYTVDQNPEVEALLASQRS